MSTHKHFDKICCVVLAVTLLLTLLFVNAQSLGIQKASTVMGYENKLFDTSVVHTLDIIIDDWDEFVANCKSEEYYICSVVIDNEAYKNVAIRGKGNTSLTQVDSYGNDRYSFKIEFDHYDSTNTYYGLDKLCLNNIIQDNTYMKDYLTYQMMAQTGVASPLCSYVYITVNGEDWGLYLAVEGVEDSFLRRNYGSDYGELYKPDSQSMGGGRGNGEKFDMDEFFDSFSDLTSEDENVTADVTTRESPETGSWQNAPELPDGDMPADMGMDGQMPTDMGMDGQMPSGDMPGGMPFSEGNAVDPNAQGDRTFPSQESASDQSSWQGENFFNAGGNNFSMVNGSDDVLLKYIDDDPDSYSNIFDNAKTDVSDSDKERLIAALKKLSGGEEIEDTVDVESVIRYFVVHNFVLNFDSYTGSMIHNYYLYEEDGQLQMIPWDYNLAFGGFESAGGATNLVNYPIDSPVSGGNASDRPMIAWIFESEEYTELYHEYFAEFISEYFDSGYFEKMIDSVWEMISPYVEKDPTKFCTFEEFELGVSTLKEFCLLRAESVSGQLDGTIGSTSQTQTDSALIDASHIEISDMGSMNVSMGGDNDRHSRTSQGESDGRGDSEKTDSSAEKNQQPAEGVTGGMQTAPQMPDGMGENGGFANASPQMPDGGNFFGDGNTDAQQDANGFGGFDFGNGQSPMQKPDGTGRDAEQTGDFGQKSADSALPWIWLAICAAVLALGLVFAILFKRHR